jgi:hypothetical protein
MITKIDAILSLIPGAGVVVRGSGLDAEVEWITPSTPPITEEAIAAEYERLLQGELVPREVTAWQAKHALLQAGLFETVDAAINAMTGNDGISARIDWQTAATFRRDWPLIEGMRQILGKTPAEIDQLFVLAATL